MRKNKDLEIQSILLQKTSFDIELSKNEWFDIEFYNNFKVSCVFTSIDSSEISSFFSNTRFEPLVTFTFYSEDDSANEKKDKTKDKQKYFCFCSQQTLAIIQFKDGDKNLNSILQSMTRAFLIPSSINDSKEFISNTANQPKTYPLNLVNYEDSYIELDHFYKYYIEKIHFNNIDKKKLNLSTEKYVLSTFLTISLKPALLFLIRRNYFPLVWFNNQSFSTQSIFSTENSNTREFQIDDFVFLRDILTFEDSTESLYIHKETGSLLVIKNYKSSEKYEFEKEVFYNCRCKFIRPCYGFVKSGAEFSLVLEPMSNGKASDVLKNDSLEAIMKSKIVTEVILGIDTLNARGYVITSFDKDCVYFDRDVCSYISDLRCVKRFDESVSTKTFVEQTKLFAQFIKDVGGPNFPEAESGPIVHLFAACSTNSHDENPSIFSMVNSLKKKRLFFSWTMKDLIYDSLKDLFSHQIVNNRKDIEIIQERANSKTKRDLDAELIIALTYFSRKSVSVKKALEYLMKQPISEVCQPVAHHLALYLEVMKIPEFFTLITSLASNGHVLSQAYVGIVSYRPKYPYLYDVGRAFEWLSVAANSNCPEALFSLGTLYEEGTFVERDINLAIKYYMKSADLFFHRANYRIGKLFYYGIGVRQDDEMAFTYLTMASLANIVEANTYLAKILIRNSYDFDLGKNEGNEDEKVDPELLARNEKVKKMILNLLISAAKVGVTSSQRTLHKFIYQDTKNFDKQSIFFLKRALTARDTYSIKKYAEMNLYDNSVFVKDENEGYRWFRTAAELGEKESQYLVGLRLIEEGDIDNGLLYVRESVRQGYAEAQFYLGQQYLLGKPKGVVSQNIIKGVGLIQMAMNQNYPLAFEKIGELFLDNNYLMSDYIQAFYYLNFAFRLTTPKAPYFIGVILENGLGCKHDYEMALKMYQKCFRNAPLSVIRYLSMIKEGRGIQKQSPNEIIDQMKKIINLTPQTIPKINCEYMRFVGEGLCGVELNYTESYLMTTSSSSSKANAKNKKNKPKNAPTIGTPPHIIYGNYFRIPLVQSSELINKVIQMPDLYDDGDMQGLFIQGRMIEMGDPQHGINGDPKRAFKIYKKCAIKGNNVNAMYEIGRCYEHGDCVKKDLEAAFRWYLTCVNETSNNNNNIKDDGSNYDDNYYYYYDEDDNNYYYSYDSKNETEETEETEEIKKDKAPLKDCQIEALYKVGAMLYRGLGVNKKNLSEARRFLIKASEYKHVDAQAELSYLLYEIGDFKGAIKYSLMAAEGGNPFAQILYAQLCRDGLVQDKDSKQAIPFLKSAEQKGINEAQFLLGKLYEDDQNDLNSAYQYFIRASQKDNKEAKYEVALIHLEGMIDNKRDIPEALKYFKSAANIKENEHKCKCSIHPYYSQTYEIEQLNNNMMFKDDPNSFNTLMNNGTGKNSKKLTKNNISTFFNIIKEKTKCAEKISMALEEDEEELDQYYVHDFINIYYDYIYQKDRYFNFNSYLKRNNIQLKYKYGNSENDCSLFSGHKLKINSKAPNYTRYTDPDFITSSLPNKFQFFLASTSTSSLAMLKAARIYNRGGPGVEVKKCKAAKWFKLAAENGNSSGMYSYASLLDKGYLPSPYQKNSYLAEREKDSSLEWLSLAAKRGETKAFGKIMHMYACGLHRKKLDTSVRVLQELIDKKDDVSAMIDLGDYYYYGNSQSGNNSPQIRDVARAIDLYQRAAEKDSDVAQYKLAVIYEAADKIKAASLFEKSAKNGNLASMVFIADINNKNKQYGEALKWYEKCSKAGLTHAKLVIGRMYAEGQGTATDKKKAEVYFKEASECGSAEGMFECAKLLVEDQQPNFRRIMSLLFRSADGGCGEAMNMLGLMYREGLGVISDELRAKIWFARGSDRGCNQATLNLAKMNYEGFHSTGKNSSAITKDIPAAIELFSKASKKGSIVAKLYLAKIIKNGEGCNKDEAKAGELYMDAAKMEGMETTDAGLEDLRLAAECKNPAACNIIAQRIIDGREDNENEELRLNRLRGKITEAEEKERRIQNTKRAINYFSIAAKFCITNALFQLGKLFESSKSPGKNRDKAIMYYKEAAEEGSEQAIMKLKDLAPDIKFKRCEDCPTNKNADKPIKMHAFECLSCNLVNNHVICPKCAFSCHKNHLLIDVGVKNNVFCCCTLCKGALKH